MKVFWAVGESSGDRHAAELIRELKQAAPDWQHMGMVGRAMVRAGCEEVADLSEASVMGITEVVRSLPALLRLRDKLVYTVEKRGCELVVLVDFPDFNISLARALRARLGDRVKLLYYVSPQVWAWRRGRIRTIAGLMDAMAVLFPFEKEIYRKHGLETVFFGHPMAGEVKPSAPVKELRERYGLKEGHEAVAILPGSRLHEVQRHLPRQMAAVELLRRKREQPIRALIARASTVDAAEILRITGRAKDVEIVEDATADALAVSRVALVKSGTSTVEAALVGTPFTVLYVVSPLTYLLGRLLIRGVKNIAMVNLLAGETVVPERIQQDATPLRLAADLDEMWEGEKRRQVEQKLSEVAASLGEGGATRRMAQWMNERFGA